MIAIAKLETLRTVAAAVESTEDWEEAWWVLPGVETALGSGERLGWLSRLSTTQVHWTEAGVAAFAEFQPLARSRSGRGAHDLAARAMAFLLRPAGLAS